MTQKILLAGTAVIIAVLVTMLMFGDNIRNLFGMSADALAGNDRFASGAPPAVADASLTKKTMRNFGANTAYDLGASYAPVATGNSHTQVDANRATDTSEDALSTFAIDVDTASYTLGRRTLLEGNLRPLPAGVRVEEWVNAFRYQLPEPKDAPFSVSVEGAPSPYTAGRTIVKVALKGREVANADRLPAHLVFLVDTSGSMQSSDKLPLARQSLKLLTSGLNERDTVALITYAGSVREVLAPTPASDRSRIFGAIDSLVAGGGTAMGDGMTLAYQHAVRGVSKDAVSRVIVLTDGDANIGRNQSAETMLASVKGYVKEGVTLTTVGFGMGNYRDNLMEQLADKGNGQSLYIDSLDQAKKVFQTDLAGTLETIARDVKVQVAWNKAAVKSYRLIGYENRAVADRDFRNDDVDGGEIGAGHSVTALYELDLVKGASGHLGEVTVRGQRPRSTGAFETAVKIDRGALAASLESASTELRFAAAVAGAADILRGNGPAADLTLTRAVELARGATRGLEEREELVRMLERAVELPTASVASAVDLGGY